MSSPPDAPSAPPPQGGTAGGPAKPDPRRSLGLVALCFACLLSPAVFAAEASELEAVPAAAATALPADARVLRDIAYGPDARQKIDLYLPAAQQGPAPLVVMVHGGAWRLGDKANAGVADAKAARWLPKGWALASVNYRMLPDVAPLAQAADVARALAMLQRRAGEWQLDAGRVALMGHSAGAHLVALLSADPSLAAAQGAQRWAGTVALDSAALDVPALMARRHPRLYDRAFGGDAAHWSDASPAHRLTRVAVPLHATCSTQRRDNPCAQAESYAARAQAQGARAEVQPAAKSHGEMNAQVGRDEAYTVPIEAFLESVGFTLNAPGPSSVPRRPPRAAAR